MRRACPDHPGSLLTASTVERGCQGPAERLWCCDGRHEVTSWLVTKCGLVRGAGTHACVVLFATASEAVEAISELKERVEAAAAQAQAARIRLRLGSGQASKPGTAALEKRRARLMAEVRGAEELIGLIRRLQMQKGRFARLAEGAEGRA